VKVALYSDVTRNTHKKNKDLDAGGIQINRYNSLKPSSSLNFLSFNQPDETHYASVVLEVSQRDNNNSSVLASQQLAQPSVVGDESGDNSEGTSGFADGSDP